jgi:hypothetical protein
MVSARHAVLLLLAIALTACEIGSTTIPLSEPQIVVHGILDASTPTHTILIEESLTGKSPPGTYSRFDPNNPIVSGNGIPVSGAAVTVTASDGIVYTAAEARQGGASTGIYVFTANLLQGARYTLSVKALGKTVTGSTTIPGPAPAGVVTAVSFNRDHDVLGLPIPDVPATRAYWIRVDALGSSFHIFTLDRNVSLAGDTRNLFSDNLNRVFTSGFEQDLTIAAMDSNVYDYFRSGNDDFSGVGLINHLTGGLGLFGSVATVDRKIVDVTQDDTGDSIEGTYTLRLGGGAATPHTFRVYLDAKAAKEGGDDALSGYWLRGSGSTATRGGIHGVRNGTSISWTAFESRSTNDVFATWTGTIRGDTLRVTANVASWFVKVGK